MKEIKKEMIKDFEINKLKFDFMGYTFNNTKEFLFPKNTKQRNGKTFLFLLNLTI